MQELKTQLSLLVLVPFIAIASQKKDQKTKPAKKTVPASNPISKQEETKIKEEFSTDLVVRPILPSGTEINFTLEFMNIVRTFSIDVKSCYSELYTDFKGQVISLLEKKLELGAAIRKVYHNLVMNKKTKTMVAILAEGVAEGIIGQDYKYLLHSSKIRQLVQLLTESADVTKEDIDEANQKLLNEPRIGFGGLYVVVNKEQQAKDILRYIDIGINSQRSPSEAFTEAASQYALVKPLEVGYLANEVEIINRFGNEVLEAIRDTRDGSCSKPIKLPGSEKWMIVWLREASTIKLNESYVFSYAVSAKIEPAINKEIERLTKNGELKILANQFDESDLDQNVTKDILIIGPYKITNQDLCRFLENTLDNRSLKQVILSYPPQSRGQVINYFLQNGCKLMISFYVKALIAKALDLDKDLKEVHIDYQDTYKLLYKYARTSINDEAIRAKFDEVVPTLLKTIVSVEYICLESKKVVDNLLRLLLNNQQEAPEQLSLQKLFSKLQDEYSIDKNSIFEDRVIRMKEFFGNMEVIERVQTKVDEPMKANTIYLFHNNKSNLYYILLCKSVDDEKNLTYDEMKKDILHDLTKAQIEVLYSQTKLTIQKDSNDKPNENVSN